MIDRASLRMSAVLLLAGQVLYIVVTQFHAGGAANDHPAIFAVYAGSGIWKAVHVGQFMCAAILLAGLVVLPFAVNGQAGSARWVGRFGAASAVVALALYGVLQAVDYRPGGRITAGYRQPVGHRRRPLDESRQVVSPRMASPPLDRLVFDAEVKGASRPADSLRSP